LKNEEHFRLSTILKSYWNRRVG